MKFSGMRAALRRACIWSSGPNITPGDYFPDREQPPLSSEETDVVRRFHDLYYRRWLAGADTINLSWFGYQTLKCPFDLWMYQEILVRSRPDFVVETGTKFGGSALFLAMIFDQVRYGHVITVDINPQVGRPKHPRITYLTGSSTDSSIIMEVEKRTENARVLVILDSDHSAAHVLNEITAYSPLVQMGDYLIVEDTNVNGHPTSPNFGPGPMEAVETFLSGNDEFAGDQQCERFMMTLNPKGYLRRVKPVSH